MARRHEQDSNSLILLYVSQISKLKTCNRKYTWWIGYDITVSRIEFLLRDLRSNPKLRSSL